MKAEQWRVLRGMAMEGLRAWYTPLFLACAWIPVQTVLDGSAGGRGLRKTFLQVFIFVAFWTLRQAPSRFFLGLPMTARQLGAVVWMLVLPAPLAILAVIIAATGLAGLWHGTANMHLLGIRLLGMLAAVALAQSLLAFGVTTMPDAARRVGWRVLPGRAGTWVQFAVPGLAYMIGIGPMFGRYDWPLPVSLGMFALCAAVGWILWRHREVLAMRTVLLTAAGEDDPAGARGWMALWAPFAKLLPLLIFLQIGLALPLLSNVSHPFPALGAVMTLTGTVVASAMLPVFLLPGIRMLRLVAIAPSDLGVCLLGLALVSPAIAACILVVGAGLSGPQAAGPIPAVLSWMLPVSAIVTIGLPLALRSERLWVMGAVTTVPIALFGFTAAVLQSAELVRLDWAASIGIALVAVAGTFTWLRHEIIRGRGLRLRRVEGGMRAL
jgi:hypothetical protein